MTDCQRLVLYYESFTSVINTGKFYRMSPDAIAILRLNNYD